MRKATAAFPNAVADQVVDDTSAQNARLLHMETDIRSVSASG
jgi:hypothetical protein